MGRGLKGIATMAPKTARGSEEEAFMLIGNPNCGKTSLFNQLTGLRQRIGNYAGVTVESKEGTCFTQHGKPIRLVDLPGTYSLNVNAPDEAVVLALLTGQHKNYPRPTGIICVVDATNLERHLYLATQIIELGLPVILVLNMMDVAQRRGIHIDQEKLGQILGVKVVGTRGNSKNGAIPLRLALSQPTPAPSSWRCQQPHIVQEAHKQLRQNIRALARFSEAQANSWATLLLLQENAHLYVKHTTHSKTLQQQLTRRQQQLDQQLPTWREDLIAARYASIASLCKIVIASKQEITPSFTDRIDNRLLHPIWGWGILGLLLSTLFTSVFFFAEIPMTWIEEGIHQIRLYAQAALPNGPLQNLITDGIIAGVGSVLVFLPQILLLFFFIGLLESTGYMARASFLLDRLMGKVGLPGKAFIPLLSSYACAIPGIMATRTIESPKERLATILVAPFASCSARLPIYLLMIATLLPRASAWQKTGLLLAAYALGTLAIFGLAWLFRQTICRGQTTTPVMELPPYRWPAWKNVLLEMRDRAWLFVKRAGTVILAASIILWAMLHYPQLQQSNELNLANNVEHSIAGAIGQYLEPVFSSLGYDWRITVGILASFTARELFISTMAIVYNAEKSPVEGPETLATTLCKQHYPDGTLVYTPLTCLSLMVFYIFAMQCLSTLIIVWRETNSWRWPVFQFVYMFAIAYTGAWAIYQGGRFLGFS